MFFLPNNQVQNDGELIILLPLLILATSGFDIQAT
jgi:hypothetical protein